ncbi:hypothetical protein [Streptomyces canus]|uniref:hypothetical protein n=1 Tax=Streptomyces canus TaxID=58343 RepID=UPI002E35BEF0|nr:hypothetical protein [Streptomyces canus]
MAAATTALIAGAPTADRYKALIYKLLAKNYRDYAGGTGLKFIPSASYNSRALMNGTVLPHGGWIFASNSGLVDTPTVGTQQ